MYYVTTGADSVISSGAPLPPFGKPLRKMKAVDWTAMVERGIVQFGEVLFISYI
jgi:hypothetical protein